MIKSEYASNGRWNVKICTGKNLKKNHIKSLFQSLQIYNRVNSSTTHYIDTYMIYETFTFNVLINVLPIGSIFGNIAHSANNTHSLHRLLRIWPALVYPFCFETEFTEKNVPENETVYMNHNVVAYNDAKWRKKKEMKNDEFKNQAE